MTDSTDRGQALTLFEKQIDSLMRDDREAQMCLYTEDFCCEFPFAIDRPRLIEGRDAFRAVMTPLWEEARRQGARVLSCRHEFHATDEPGLFVAVFALDVSVAGKTITLPFVQLLRIRGDRIAEVREYFSPAARSAANLTAGSVQR